MVKLVPVKAYGIFCGNVLLVGSIRRTRREAVRDFERTAPEPWASLRKRRWRVARVEVREVEPAGG